jgi:hypothetical protein
MHAAGQRCGDAASLIWRQLRNLKSAHSSHRCVIRSSNSTVRCSAPGSADKHGHGTAFLRHGPLSRAVYADNRLRRAQKLAAATSFIPATSQRRGLNVGLPQSYGSQPEVSASQSAARRDVAAQCDFGLNPKFLSADTRFTGTCRKRTGWTVNPSA